MSLFDDPEWGSSQVFTYYPSPDSAISSSADNIQQNFKNKRRSSKNREPRKKIKLSGEGKTEKCSVEEIEQESNLHSNKSVENLLAVDNTFRRQGKTLNQKTNTAKKKKKSADLKKKPQNNEILVKQNSSNPRTQDTEKSKSKVTLDQDKTQIIPVKKKKKRKISSKRNKYKELHIEQCKKRASMLVNGLTGETSKNMQNDVGLLKTELSMDCNPDGNDSRDKGEVISSSASKAQTSTAASLDSESYKKEKIDTGAKAISKKKGKRSSKINKVPKKMMSEADSAAAPQRLDQNGIARVTDTHEMNESTSELTGRINSDKTCKKKKKKRKAKGTSSCTSQTLDSGDVIKKGTDKISQTSEVNEKKKGKRNKKKVTKENENICSKKKLNKDSQEKGLSKHRKDEVNSSSKKKRTNKDEVNVSKGQEEEELEFEAEEFEGDDADSDLEHDLEAYLKELNFDRPKHDIDDDDALSASAEMEMHSDDAWESENSISDEESADEHLTGNDNSKVIHTSKPDDTAKHVKDKIKKVSAGVVENNSSIVIPKDDEHRKANPNKGKKFDLSVLSEMLKDTGNNSKEADPKQESRPVLSATQVLKQKMTDQLNAARFRFVNEQMYTSTSKDALKMFKTDRKSFDSYHRGFQSQVSQWPINPLDLIIKWLKKKSKKWVVADFGCGEAILAEQVSQETVHSFDLAAANSRVTVCDMAHTPLPSDSVDVVVFCLSLMGTNIKDFIIEANRVLHEGGIMKIAEVESRFSDVDYFINHVKKFGFHCTYSDTSMKYFYTFDFKKHRSLKNKKDFPDIILKPCKYKKR